MPLFSRKKAVDAVKPSSAPSSPARKPVGHQLPINGSLNAHPLHLGPSAGFAEDNFPFQREPLLSPGEEDSSSFLFVTPLRTRSRLSETFEEVLRDQTALGFFIQYMDSRDATALVRFWLDSESFLASARMRMQSNEFGKSGSTSSVLAKLKDANRHLSGSDPCLSSGGHHTTTEAKFNRDAHSNKVTRINNNFPETSSLSLCDTTCVIPQTLSSNNSVVTNPAEAVRTRRDSGSGDSIASRILADDPKCCLTVDVTCLPSVQDGSISCAASAASLSTLSSAGSGVITKSGHSALSAPSERVNRTLSVRTVNSFSAISGVTQDSAKTSSELACHSRSASVDSSISEKLKKSIAEDAVKIFTKYIAKDAQFPIGVSDEMRNEITAKICCEDGQVDPTCFSSAQQLVQDTMQREYFPDYVQSDYHCKYQIDVLTSGKVHLEDILYNETALSFFMEYVEQEGKRPLLEFWLTADNFRQQLMTQKVRVDFTQAQDDAMVIYDKYFSLQATTPLGFSDAVRFEVEQNICREEGPLPDCYEKPVKMVFHYLQKNYLKGFLTSQLYFTYLSELLNSARSTNDLVGGSKRRAGSDTSSEHSVSMHNTLLAMDSGQPGVTSTKKILHNVDHQDMRIDAGVFHPDALWKRDMSGCVDLPRLSSVNKLSFGRVNSLGQFIPELEPEPDKKKSSESVLTKAMKRLVNREEDKVKEEMAWQIAEMIVKEVTSITGAGDDVKFNQSS